MRPAIDMVWSTGWVDVLHEADHSDEPLLDGYTVRYWSAEHARSS